MTYRSPWMTPDLDALRAEIGKFVKSELAPETARWRDNKIVDRSAWTAMGAMGMLCASIPESYGGLGGTFAHEAAIMEEVNNGATEILGGIVVHSAIVAHYLLAYGTEDQKRRILPRMATGDLIGAIAMTEPGGGSDLQAMRTRAVRDGNGYRLSGAKTFITNGQLANLIIVAAKTDPAQGAKGVSLFLVETDGADGFRRGRNLDKIGQPAADTSELFFDDVMLPAESLLGTVEGQGFVQMMQQLPQERLALAVCGVAAMERALDLTVDYTKERGAFGKKIIEFQNSAFKLAERKTEAVIARIFVDQCVERLIAGTLDTVTASMAKWWVTEKQCETVDACLQLHGGYGYMNEYEIARMYVDARIQKIYGGTNEIMKLLIARSL